MRSSVHIGNKRKDTLNLGKEPAQGLDDTTLTTEAIYPINFAQPNKRFELNLHYSGSNSLYISIKNKNISIKIYQFKAKKPWNKRLWLVFR